MKNEIKGIIFDMDNTLLRSAIDFTAMKKEIYRFLAARQLLPTGLDLTEHTTATVIREAMRTGRMTPEWTAEMWEIANRFEVAGMLGADLESGVAELLDDMRGSYCLAVVTNNSVEAAETALRENGIRDHFDCVVGRGMVEALKPEPDGFLHVLNRFSHIAAPQWISVGDAWIDGEASGRAGIRFVSYRGDTEKMKRMGVRPSAELADMRELRRLIDESAF